MAWLRAEAQPINHAAVYRDMRRVTDDLVQAVERYLAAAERHASHTASSPYVVKCLSGALAFLKPDALGLSYADRPRRPGREGIDARTALVLELGRPTRSPAGRGPLRLQGHLVSKRTLKEGIDDLAAMSVIAGLVTRAHLRKIAGAGKTATLTQAIQVARKPIRLAITRLAPADTQLP